MQKPKTIPKSALSECWVELSLLYVLVTFAEIFFLKAHWATAVMMAPLGVAIIVAGVLAFVQLLWLFVRGMERIGEACGMRKTPLS